MADPDAKGAPKPPPNLRIADSEDRECGSCTYSVKGKTEFEHRLMCSKYSGLPVDDEWVCASWKKGGEDSDDADGDDPEPKTLQQAGVKAQRDARRRRQASDVKMSEK